MVINNPQAAYHIRLLTEGKRCCVSCGLPEIDKTEQSYVKRCKDCYFDPEKRNATNYCHHCSELLDSSRSFKGRMFTTCWGCSKRGAVPENPQHCKTHGIAHARRWDQTDCVRTYD